MRILLAIVGLVAFFSSTAQTWLPAGQQGLQPGRPFPNNNQSVDSNSSSHKWQLTPYAGISAGTFFYTGRHPFFPGGASYLSVPVGLQLTRPLNSNLYAFAGVSAAPTVFTFNHLYTQPANNYPNPGYFGSRSYNLGMNARVEMGLMYINDDKTFSISGSIGVERSSYSAYPSYRPVTKQQ